MSKYSVVTEIAKSGVPTLKVGNRYTHSKYDPIKESKQIAKNNYQPHHLHILYGYGLGYVAEELVKEFKFNEPLLIIDPLLDSEEITMSSLNYERLYQVKSNDYVRISGYLSNLGSYNNKMTVIIQNNYTELFTENLIKILSLVKDSQIREIYNVNTINLFAIQWQLNSFMNMRNIVNDKSLEELFLKYTEPVVIASGGPSLVKQLELIKEYRNKMILICAGTTINTLLKYGVTPDYVVSIDGGEINYSHYTDVKDVETKLLYTPTNHRKIRDNFKNTGYVFIPGGLSTLKKYYEYNTKKNLPIILGGGSVAHYAFTIAKKITTGPIALIGQDLAYTNGMSHADGNKGLKHSSEISHEMVEIESWDGGTVKSNDSFKTMINTFEQLQLADPHNNEVYNCTEGGAKINSILQMPFKEFIEKHCELEVNKDKVVNDFAKIQFDFEDFYQNEVSNYRAIIKMLEDGIKITEKEKGPYFNHKTLDKLSKIERKLNILYEKYNVDALLEPIIIKNEVKFLPKLNESKMEEFNRVKDYTLSLYRDCITRLKEYMEVLEQEMEH